MLIRCKLTETGEDAGAMPASTRGRAVTGQVIRIGRAPGCEIHIPNPRVRLEHACIRQGADGDLLLEAIGPVSTPGGSQELLRLTLGLEFSIGPCDFRVASLPAPSDDPNIRHLTLHFHLREKDPQLQERLLRETMSGLRSGLVTRRRLAWLMSLVVAGVLGIPFWLALQPTESAGARPEAAATGAVQPAVAQVTSWLRGAAPDLHRWWNPGPLSSPHQAAAKDCKDCHDKPFERVEDASCVQCHKSVGPHSRQLSAANRSEIFGTQRCADCHREHQGRWGMKTVSVMSCTDCHAQIRQRIPSTGLPNISDFGTDHPPLRLSIWPQRGGGPALRAEHSGALRVPTGLKFPHDLHLARQGIKSPQGPAETGGRVVMNCADCHRSEKGGNRFEPVRMAQHCQHCHRLSVDPQIPARQVPHARPEEVAVSVREVFAALALERMPLDLVTVNSLLQRPQAQSAPVAQMQATQFVQDRTLKTLSHMMEGPVGVCSTCHSISRRASSGPGSDVSWEVKPVTTHSNGLPGSRFSHSQHETAPCQTCHAANTSREASEVLIPGLKVCQDCHAGPDRAAAERQHKVASSCESCHGFHTSAQHPAFTSLQGRGVGQRAPK